MDILEPVANQSHPSDQIMAIRELGQFDFLAAQVVVASMVQVVQYPIPPKIPL
jgi:autonomous glycyl radical cofactor GrcA